jgi:hypothetical protein
MSDMTLFENSALANSDLFKSLQEVDDNLTGGGSGGGMRRISLRGGRFREIVGGDQVNVNSSGSLNIVVVNAAPVSRTYYSGTYDPENPTPPHCWSSDTNKPAPDVPADQRMATRCGDCPMNVKGSGQGESRACRYSQRIAVCLEGQYDKVYQLQLAATSVFGQAKDGKMPMQAYASYLKAHKTPSMAIVTEMYFDENSDVPKLFFKPVRPLEEAELKQVLEAKDSPDAIRAITLTVSQVDGVQKQRDGEVKSDEVDVSAKPKKSNNVLAEEVEEPKKAKAASTKKEPVDEDLASLVSDWDDE